jgi:hypothetical protein
MQKYGFFPTWANKKEDKKATKAKKLFFVRKRFCTFASDLIELARHGI